MTKAFSIESTDLFEENLKRLKKSNPAIIKRIKKFIQCKETGELLPNSYKDHSCSGNLQGCRECHLSGNILLVYKNRGNTVHLLGICNHDQLYIFRTKIDRYL